MIPRLRPMIAVARRDLVQEIRGRRGWTLVLITVGLLAPGALLGGSGGATRLIQQSTRVGGAVPEVVLALPEVEVVDDALADVLFRRVDGVLEVEALWVPPAVRSALDGDLPAIRMERVFQRVQRPQRSLLLALLASAVLTGAISESIGGERSRQTLQALLTAAVTRGEVVGGKWLAWAGYGVVAALVGAAMAMATGRQEPGWWLIPLPVVPMVTAALGFFLVRRAADVLTGATVSVRWLPFALAGSGLVAWWVGSLSPVLGAAVPLGGALIAAGAIWTGPVPPLVAAASSLLTTWALLAITARDLDHAPSEAPPVLANVRAALGLTALAAFTWWAPILGAILWGPAGNARLVEQVPRAAGPIAGGLGLTLMATVIAARATRPVPELGAWWPAGARGWALAPVATAGLCLSAGASALVRVPADPNLAIASDRLTEALEPSAWIALVLSVVGQELLFRGYLQRHVGVIASALAFALVFTPLDPVRGLLMAAILGALTVACGGAVLPAMAARIAAAVIVVQVPPIAAVLGGGAVIGLLTALRPRA